MHSVVSIKGSLQIKTVVLFTQFLNRQKNKKPGRLAFRVFAILAGKARRLPMIYLGKTLECLLGFAQILRGLQVKATGNHGMHHGNNPQRKYAHPRHL